MTATTADQPPRITTARKKQSFATWFTATGWRHLVGIATVIFAAFPLLYVLSSSLNPNGTLVGSNALFTRIDLANYIGLFSRPQQPYAAWYLNTLFIGGASAIGTVFLGALAAYSFSRMRRKT